MSGLEKSLYALHWNNIVSVAIITLISYEYMLQFEKEVTFVWVRAPPQRHEDPELTGYAGKTVVSDVISIPCCELHPAKVLHSFPFLLICQVRYFGIVHVMICAIWGGLIYIPEAPYVRIVSISYSTETSFAHHEIEIGYGMFLFMKWSFSVYLCLAEVILIWRLYVLYNQSKFILYLLLGLFLPIVALYIWMNIWLWSRPSAISVQEIIITPNIKYCTTFYHIGVMPALYASIPVICYDIFLVVLAIAVLRKHLKERKELEMKPNTYVVMIVRHHVIYFVL
ncbi:hypothetical protein DFJ58DRAFT_727645 [Suillus subalutaceus]|uniref:uncharacterized protein n=1 Tax=Suillus subalutaceus TaxID=48586 RepID=UPI001B86C317|nr:uncharacterized protein DFJ58DRAFT_727645 [Suillus subalutaceus]KAG1855202.1 hypothetical protein DFJ58DRAFT_727645 [Suillus subalutaceus]